MVSLSKISKSPWIIALFWVVATHTTQAADYLTFDQAMQLAFPNSGKVERYKPAITPEQQRQILDKSGSKSQASLGGIYVGHSGGQVDGIAIVDHVIGRTEYITWLCVLSPSGTIRRMEVMTYREPYGSEIRDRRFLDQFANKDETSPIRVGHEISNIGGATLSVNALVDRARFLVHLHAIVIEPTLTEWLVNRDSPAATTKIPNTTTRTLPIGNSPLTVQITPASAQAEKSAEAGLAAAQTLDMRLNAWRAEAELAAVNAGKNKTVSDDLLHALQLAQRGHELSGGLFDPSIFPLLQVWKTATETGQAPSADVIQQAQSLINYKRVTIEAETKTIDLPAGMQLDLSGLNKGLLIDRVGKTLALQSTQSALVSHGGSSWLALGAPHAELHTITIRHPADPTRIHQSIVLQPGQGFGTAASNGRTLVVGGATYSHLINPLTGQPASLQRAASVIAENAALADVLDTTLCLMSVEQGLALIESIPGAAALLWDGTQFHPSSRWPK